MSDLPLPVPRRLTNSKNAKRPISFAASPLRAANTSANEIADNDFSKRRLSQGTMPGSASNFSLQHSPKQNVSSNNFKSNGEIALQPGDPKPARSLKSNGNHTIAVGPNLSEVGEERRASKSTLSFASLVGSVMAKKRSVKKSQSNQIVRISEAVNMMGTINSNSTLELSSDGAKPVTIHKPILRVTNPNLIDDDASFAASFMSGRSIKYQKAQIDKAAENSWEFHKHKISPQSYKVSLTGSIKHLLHLRPHPEVESDENPTEEDDIVDLEVRRSLDSLASNEIDGYSLFSGGRASVLVSEKSSKNLNSILTRSGTVKTNKSDVARFDNVSERDLERRLTDKKAVKAIVKAIDTIKANNTKKGLGWGELMLINGVVQAVISGCLECYIFWAVWKFLYVSWGRTSGSAEFILAYFGLFILAEIFMTLGLIDAAWNKNTMQVVACMLFNIGILSYSFIQMNHINDRIKLCSTTFLDVYSDGGYPYIASNSTLIQQSGNAKFNLLGVCPWQLDAGITERLAQNIYLLDNSYVIEILIVGVSGLGNLFGLFLGFKTYQEYGWSLYQIQGASITRKWIITRYHLFILLLKANIFFTLGFATQMIAAFYYSDKGVSDRKRMLSTPWTLGATNQTVVIADYSGQISGPKNFLLPSAIAGAIVATCSYILGWSAIRRCSKNLMYAFLAIMFLDFIAAFYGLVAVHSDPKYEITRTPLALFCMVQMLINLVTWVVGFMNMRDFGRGLRELLQASAKKETGIKKERELQLD
ncbi:hypothetical protein BJ741DRAFT_629603 [Chytriomyces cf. hyalinus JEL632]|nr:hypothetical protein BJ741DRAFT_629603 [Chytriomyces cf. hyalinus JEL632]